MPSNKLNLRASYLLINIMHHEPFYVKQNELNQWGSCKEHILEKKRPAFEV